MTTPDNPSNSWSAAAWIGISRSSSDSSLWVDSKGATLNYIPWCPGEPNYKESTETCASMLTFCAPGGSTAMANDYDCSRPLRVICAVETEAGSSCSELLSSLLRQRSACLPCSARYL
jgi:hypothetical protein